MNRSIVRFGLSFVSLQLLALHTLAAQSIPRVSIDAVAGSGSRTSVVGETWFRQPNREDFARIAASVRIVGRGRIALLASGEYAPDVSGDQVAVCGLAPNGTCFKYFAPTNGPSAALAIRAAATNRVGVGVNVGAANYHATVPFAGAEASVRIVGGVHLLANVRYARWHDAADQTVWFRPVGLGLRWSSRR